MPKIPEFTSTRMIPGESALVPISPERAGMEYGAWERGGAQIERAGLHAANVFGELARQEQNASDDLQAIEYNRQVREGFGKIAEGLRGREDYQNFDTYVKGEMQNLKQTLQPKNPSQRLATNVERIWASHEEALVNTARTKKYQVMGERGQIAFQNIVDDAADQYALETDPAKKEAIKNSVEVMGQVLKNDYLLDPKWVNERIRGFEKYAKQKAQETYKVMADELIRNDPAQAVINLVDKHGWLPEFVGEARESKIDKANSAFKIWQAEQDKKQKEQEKLDHDFEERSIGDLFLAEKYKDAYLAVQNSKRLTGDEKRTWGNAIDQKTKEKTEVIDPVIEAAEIVRTNAMISQGILPPSAIRNHIITTPKLSKANKEQYINKLETKLTSEIEDGRRDGYKDIQNIIFPPARGLSIDSLIQTPQQTQAIMRAQMALDNWISSQLKAQKFPTRNEIRQQAQSLAQMGQVRFQDKIKYLENELEKLGK